MARIGTHSTALAVRDALCQAVAELGVERAGAGPGLEPLLIDLTDGREAERRRWVRMLAEVAELGIVIDLRDPDRRGGAHDRICEETALSSDAAAGVFEAWWDALGVEPPAVPGPAPVPPEVRSARPRRLLPPEPEPDPEPAERPSAPLVPDGAGINHHRVPVTAAALSPHGHLVASGAQDGSIWLQWADDDRALPCGNGEADFHGAVTTMSFTTDGRMLASGSQDGTVRLWDTGSGVLEGELAGHGGGVTAVDIYRHRHGTMLAAGAADGTITLWSIPDGELLRQIGGHPDAVRTLAFRRGGRVLVSGGDDGAVRMWLSESGTRGHVLNRGGPVGAVALSQDGRYLAAADPAKVAVRRFAWPPTQPQFSATIGQVLRGDVFFLTGAEVTDEHPGVCTLAFEPEGELVAGGTVDGSVVVWKPGAGKDVGRSTIHVGPVVTVAFTGKSRASFDGVSLGRLVSVGADGAVRFWRWGV